MNRPQLSIIIPCYNSESTLDKTIQSVIDQDYQEWEAIVVNDGSIDNTHEIALYWAEKDSRVIYFIKENEGLGKTRNFGIQKAQGKYILPLDSDNLVVKDFAKDAIEVLENNREIGVVHGYAEFFGERSGLWKIESFDLEKIIIENYIDACAIYRKEIWTLVGGYDENMPYQGHEDWEFWIALGSNNVEFHNLNKTTFNYFVANNSMIRSFTEKMIHSNKVYLFKKYYKLYYKLYIDLEKNNIHYFNSLKSEKFVIDLFFKTFFGFTLFGKYKKQ